MMRKVLKRKVWHSIFLVWFGLCVAPVAYGFDTYNVGTGQLTIPSLTIGGASYSNVVLPISGVVSVGAAPAIGVQDTYYPTNNQLTIPSVLVGSTTYYNVVATVGGLTAIGSVTGADFYDGSYLTIPSMLVGNTTYTNVVVTVGSVIAVAGGMPKAVTDSYDSTTHQLTIPVVQVGITAYSNVTITVGSFVSGGVIAGAGKIYVIGASYSSDGPEDARVSTVVSGDARNVNGPIGQSLWVEIYAKAIGTLIPVSTTRVPETGQSSTNFARGGSFSIEERTTPPTPKLTATDAKFICNSGSVGCGDYNGALIKFPRSAYDQWLALAATSPSISNSDVFAIDEAENDLVRYYRNNNGPAGTTFINDRADVLEGILKLAISGGFKKVVIANVPPLHLLPGASGIGTQRLSNLASDVALLNTAIGARVSALRMANPNVQFYKADWNTAFTNAINGVGIWSGVSSNDSAEAQNPGFATSQSASLNVKWWDSANVHPSAKLHKYMAENYIGLWP